MVSIKVQMVDFPEDSSSEDISFKTVYLDGDKISSFSIEGTETYKGETHQIFGIVCDNEYYSVKHEPHVYEFIYDRFIKNAIKG